MNILNQMKVLHINTSTSGGAAIAAIRLHKGLFEKGVDSHILTLNNTQTFIPNHYVFNGNIKNEKPSYPLLTLRNWLKEKFYKEYENKNKEYLKKIKFRNDVSIPKFNNGIQNFGLFSFPDSNYDITETQIYKEADIIHLHWVAGFLDYKSFFKKNKKPIIWTMHDANPFLGGFHHKDDSMRNVISHSLLENEIIELKKEIYTGIKNMKIISPSFWLAKDAKDSNVFSDKEILTIRNGIDFSIFRNRGKEISRSILNLPLDKRIFLLASSDLSDYRKGIDLVVPIIMSDEFQNDIFLLAGNNFNDNKFPNVIALGGIHDEILMSIVYSASDFFILPSRLDNLPNTMLESIACETPVIGFDIGDNREFISKQGIVVKDTNEMKNVLNSNFYEMVDFTQKRIDFELNNIVLEYKKKYKELLK